MTVPTLPIALAMTLFLVGCNLTQTTRTVAIETDRQITTRVCRIWKPVTYSSRDTEQTQIEARSNNAARGAYCKGVE